MKLKIALAVLSLMSAGAFAADATALSKSDADAGAVAGAIVETPVTTDNHATTKVLDLVAMQVAPLPPTLVSASGKFEKYGECGPRVVIEKFTRSTHYSEVLGVVPGTDKWASMHGILTGYDTANPYVVRRIKLPEPFVGEQVDLMGHQLYLAAETVGAGGGGSATGNYASERYTGLGVSSNANSAFMVVGAVALDCVMPTKTVTADPKAPTDTCTAKRDGPGVKKGDVLKYKDKKPAECDG